MNRHEPTKWAMEINVFMLVPENRDTYTKGRAVEQEAKGNASRSRVVISSKRIGTIPTISKMNREKDKIMNGPKNKK